MKTKFKDLKEETPNVTTMLVLCPPWGTRMPHLGLAYLSAYLEKHEYKHSILDLNIDLYNKFKYSHGEFWKFEKFHHWIENNRFKKLFSSYKEFIVPYVEKIMSDDAKIVCFSINISNTLFAVEIAKRIKKKCPEKIIIFGGTGGGGDYYYPKHERETISPKVFDVLVVGEGEETLSQIIDSVNNGDTFENIQGIILSEKGLFSDYNPRPLKNLDELPFPTYKKFDLSKYSTKSLPILFSRGCINKCVFCTDTLFSGRFRFRKSEKIFEEIKYHIEKNNIRHFENADLLVNGNLKELEKLCDLIISSNIKIHWGGNALIRKDMTSKLIIKMKKAGCNHLSFGLETGSDKVLRKMKKRFTISDAERVLEFTHQAKIHTSVGLIVGFPGETEKDFQKTLNFIKRNKENIDNVPNLNRCSVSRNSELYNHPEKYDVIMPDVPINHLYYQWKTKNGNDFYIRKKRFEKVLSLLSNLNIDCEQINLSKEMKFPKENITKLFFKCLKKYGLLYTINNTIYYLKNSLTKN